MHWILVYNALFFFDFLFNRIVPNLYISNAGPATKKQPLNKLIFDGCFFVLFRDESKRARFGSVVILGGLTFVNFPLCIHLC